MHFRTSWKQRGFRGLGATLGGTNPRRLIQASDFTYQGSFKLPEEGSICKSFSYGGNVANAPGGIGYNPNGNGGAGSLFIQGACNTANGGCGGGSVPFVNEVSIPTLVQSSNYTLLHAATALQSWGDITGGLGLDGNITSNNASGTKDFLGGMWFDASSGYCYWTLYNIYDTGTTLASHGYSTSPGTLATPGGHGTYKLVDSAGAIIRATAGCIADIPASWQSKFGNYTHFSGLTGPSVTSNCGNGPGMTCFNATDFIGKANISGTVVQSIPAQSYLYYPSTHFCSVWDAVGYSTWAAGGVFVDSGAVYGLVYFGQQYLNVAWYGFADYYDWRNDPGSIFPANQDHPPLVAGQTDYATYGSSAGWPSTDTGNRYYYDTTQRSEASSSAINTLGGIKGNQLDASCLGVWIYDPDVVSNNIAQGGTTYALAPSQDKYTASNSANGWLKQRSSLQPLGLAYDRAGKRVFLLQAQAYNPDTFNPYPVVHVYTHP